MPRLTPGDRKLLRFGLLAGVLLLVAIGSVQVDPDLLASIRGELAAAGVTLLLALAAKQRADAPAAAADPVAHKSDVQGALMTGLIDVANALTKNAQASLENSALLARLADLEDRLGRATERIAALETALTKANARAAFFETENQELQTTIAAITDPARDRRRASETTPEGAAA